MRRSGGEWVKCEVMMARQQDEVGRELGQGSSSSCPASLMSLPKTDGRNLYPSAQRWVVIVALCGVVWEIFEPQWIGQPSVSRPNLKMMTKREKGQHQLFRPG
jgi:hypothetical protein